MLQLNDYSQSYSNFGCETPSYSLSTYSTLDGALSYSPFDQKYAIEREACSNFRCCNQVHSNLHDLIEHFEIVHVAVQPSGATIDPSSAYSEYEGPPPFPQPDTLLAPSNTQPFYSAASEDDWDILASALYPSSSNLYGYHAPQVGQGSALDETTTTTTRLLRVDTESQVVPSWPDFEFDLSPLSSPLLSSAPTSPFDAPFSMREGESAEARTLQMNSSLESVATASAERARQIVQNRRKNRLRRNVISHGRGHRHAREKAYKCSTEGCSKSYLNPNGLKYHQEKGTCTNDHGAIRTVS